MAGRLTLGIIKPDAVERGRMGAILAHLERDGFRIRATRLVRLGQAEAEAFYAVHRERPFYRDLVEFMTSGPCLPMVLEKDDAVARDILERRPIKGWRPSNVSIATPGVDDTRGRPRAPLHEHDASSRP